MPKQPPMTPVGAVLKGKSMFAMRIPEEGGQPVLVTRSKTCDCGTTFSQVQMATSELESLERMGQLANFLRKIPDAFVPVFCPPCERRDLERQARIDAGYNVPITYPDSRRDIAS